MTATLREFLVSRDYRVETAMTGKDGLDMCRRYQPIVIVIDTMLPESSGFDVHAALVDPKNAANGACARADFLLLTPRTSDESEERAKSMDIADYRRKPLQPLELGQRIVELVDERQQ